MTCREAIDFLMDYLDDALPPDVRAEFDRHLAICPSCVAYLQSYQQTVQLGKATIANEPLNAPVEIPEELVQAMLTAVKRA